MCDFIGCGKVFKKKAGWRKHINYFHLTEGSGGVPCDDCGIVYQNFFYLRIHKRHSELRMDTSHSWQNLEFLAAGRRP